MKYRFKTKGEYFYSIERNILQDCKKRGLPMLSLGMLRVDVTFRRVGLTLQDLASKYI